mmetsp:Transcript_16385/g.45618  ORF Transcript_16385/g.45618 Transcript_16385/m.45618 type:complete len:289 (-) Transcript_16385:50-916(-)
MCCTRHTTWRTRRKRRQRKTKQKNKEEEETRSRRSRRSCRKITWWSSSLPGLLLRVRLGCIGVLRCLLKEALHELRVLHDLRTAGDLGESLLVRRELLEDPLAEDIQAERLAYGQPLDDVACVQVLGEPVRGPLGEARQPKILRQREYVLVDVLRPRVKFSRLRVLDLVDVIQHDLHGLRVVHVREAHLALTGAAALPLRQEALLHLREALLEDLAAGGEDHLVRAECLLRAHQADVRELAPPVQLAQAIAEVVVHLVLERRQLHGQRDRLGAELGHLVELGRRHWPR